MKPLVMQWHITNRCNKRCVHCYQEGYNNREYTTKELINIGEEYIRLWREYNKREGHKLKGQINITGGEPFMREDIFEILDFFKKNEDKFTFGILTNGTFLTEDMVRKLKGYGPKMVQISLDGDESMHDEIRGKGSFQEALKALKLLKKYNITSLVSFTAHNKNFRDFPKVAKVARKARAYKIWTDRLVPIGSGGCEDVKTLNKKEVIEYVNILKREKNSFTNRFHKTKIGIERSLQFLCGEGECYNCSAGDGLVIVLENGDVLPCRRLPIIAGNLGQASLREIYFNSKVMKKLREGTEIPKGCENCSFYSICKGGAKCISYGVYGDYSIGDYGCSLKNNCD